MEWEAKNRIPSDKYQYCCDCHRRGLSLVSMNLRYRNENQSRIYWWNLNRRIGNEASVLGMGLTGSTNG